MSERVPTNTFLSKDAEVKKDNDEMAVNKMNMRAGQAALSGARPEHSPNRKFKLKIKTTQNKEVSEFRKSNPDFSCADAMRELLSSNSIADSEFYGKLYNAILHDVHNQTMSEDGLIWDAATKRYCAME
jgi:hypothetical protein